MTTGQILPPPEARWNRPSINPHQSTFSFWVLTVTLLAAGALWLGPAPAHPAATREAATLCVLIGIVIAPVLTWLSATRGASFAFGPAGIPLVYLWISVISVPILWWFGLANPWDDYQSNTTSLVLAAAGNLSAVTLGVIMAGRGQPSQRVQVASRDDRRLNTGLLLLVLTGVASLVLLILAAGGLGALLNGLGARRELLAGLGLLSAGAAPAGIAAFIPLMHASPSRRTQTLGALGALTYIAFLFASGSRFPIIAFLLSLLIARHQQRGVHPRFFMIILAISLPFSTWYADTIRHRGFSPVDVGGTDVRSRLESVVDPFVTGGLDTLRTFGAVHETGMSIVGGRPADLMGGLATLVPRAIWPDKPNGISIAFAEQYFPDRWAVGTGVPPSLPAEATYLWGYSGGLLYVLLIGFLLSKWGQKLWSSASLFSRLLLPLAATDTIVLVKSGSDSFLRLLALHIIAVWVSALILSRFGVRIERTKSLT